MPQADPPSQVAPTGNPADPQRFLTTANPICSEWKAATDQFNVDTIEWQKIDPAIPASQWTDQQRNINDTVAEVMGDSQTK